MSIVFLFLFTYPSFVESQDPLWRNVLHVLLDFPQQMVVLFLYVSLLSGRVPSKCARTNTVRPLVPGRESGWAEEVSMVCRTFRLSSPKEKKLRGVLVGASPHNPLYGPNTAVGYSWASLPVKKNLHLLGGRGVSLKLLKYSLLILLHWVFY